MKVHTEALSFTYRRSTVAVLSSLTVDVDEGAVTALIGSSGSGKSTLLYLLALMMRPTSGRILWDETDVSTLVDGDRSALRARHAGFVFQDALLDPSRTVIDNLCQASLLTGTPARIAHRQAHELLEQFGIAERAKHKPGEISGGQAQRVALCRALMGEPTVIFGDEPTGNLDHETSELVWKTLAQRAAQGSSVIVATHDLARAASADHTVTLDV